MTEQWGGWVLDEELCLTEAERHKFIEYARKLPLRLYVLLALVFNAAMRCVEVVHLHVSDLLIDNEALVIIPAKKGRKKEIKGDDGKIEVIIPPPTSPVPYPLPPEVVTILREYIAADGLGPHDWLFPGRTRNCDWLRGSCPSGHLSRRSVQRAWSRLAAMAGLQRPGRGVHALRHTRLTEWAEKTHDPFAVRDAGRLSSIQMASYYVARVNLKEKTRQVGGRV